MCDRKESGEVWVHYWHDHAKTWVTLRPAKIHEVWFYKREATGRAVSRRMSEAELQHYTDVSERARAETAFPSARGPA